MSQCPFGHAPILGDMKEKGCLGGWAGIEEWLRQLPRLHKVPGSIPARNNKNRQNSTGNRDSGEGVPGHVSAFCFLHAPINVMYQLDFTKKLHF